MPVPVLVLPLVLALVLDSTLAWVLLCLCSPLKSEVALVEVVTEVRASVEVLGVVLEEMSMAARVLEEVLESAVEPVLGVVLEEALAVSCPLHITSLDEVYADHFRLSR